MLSAVQTGLGGRAAAVRTQQTETVERFGSRCANAPADVSLFRRETESEVLEVAPTPPVMTLYPHQWEHWFNSSLFFLAKKKTKKT